MGLARQFPDVAPHITATDADERLLDRAVRGVYPRGCLKELPPAWIAEGFEDCGGEFRIRPDFRSGVTFVRQDIRTEMPDGPFDLILCRNLVFTYFDLALQRTMLERLAARLRNGGYLVVGTHEALPATAPDFAVVDQLLPIYRRQARAVPEAA
jgi:chemotaxis protein methyltransferase CheR